MEQEQLIHERTKVVDQIPELQRPWYKIVFARLRRHPFLVLLGALLCFLSLEYFALPSYTAIEQLQRQNPQTTALIEARKEERGVAWKFVRKWIPLSQISPHIIHAVIVAEDGSFYNHDGFDWYEVQESLERNWDEGHIVRGASTITQQLAKNLYLSTSRDPIRKLKEFIITLRLEKGLTKNRILEIYLNTIEWGAGVFGVEAASQQYFQKSALEISREEAARLAAVIPSPLRHVPNVGSRYVTNRANIILTRMDARGW